MILTRTIIMTEMLPPLPEQHKTPEADFGLVFRRWSEEQGFASSVFFELKDTRGSASLPFSAVKVEQIAYMTEIQFKGRFTRIEGHVGEPDYGWMRGECYVVIRYPSCFCVIGLMDFVAEEKDSVRRSLTVDRAKEIARWVV